MISVCTFPCYGNWLYFESLQGADSIWMWYLTGIGNPIVEIKQSHMSTVGFPMLVRWHLYNESGLWWTNELVRNLGAIFIERCYLTCLGHPIVEINNCLIFTIGFPMLERCHFLLGHDSTWNLHWVITRTSSVAIRLSYGYLLHGTF